MARDPRIARLISIVSLVVTFHLLLVYGLPSGVFVPLVMAAGIWYWRAGAPTAAMASTVLLAGTLLYAAAVSVGGLADIIYFRPDERLFVLDRDHGYEIYQRNARLEMHMPYGDLQRLTREDIAEPRDVVYRIDSAGFRNDADYRGQRYLLVGDSLVVGSGNTQSDTLASQLERDHGLPVYNLAHPGDAVDYARYVAGFRADHGNEFRVLLFLSEGSDFINPHARRRSALSQGWRDYYEMFSDLDVHRLTKHLFKTAGRRFSPSSSRNLLIARLAGRPVGFYESYIAESQRASTAPVEELERSLAAMRGNLERIYFIPTKYRVYRRHLASGDPLPHANWEYLQRVCARAGYACTDLTPYLVAASDDLLGRGLLTWWADDTHWNRHGMAVAARVIAELTPAAGAAAR